jgi:hypothetical protein
MTSVQIKDVPEETHAALRAELVQWLGRNKA